jgi:hypothetical protein
VSQGPEQKGVSLNGSSLSSLVGADVHAKIVSEVRLPASSIAEVLETVHRLGYTGNLQVNFHRGRALDLKWTSTSDTRPPAV